MAHINKMTKLALFHNMKIYFLASLVALAIKKISLHFQPNENLSNFSGVVSFSTIAFSFTKPIIAAQALTAGLIHSFLNSDQNSSTKKDTTANALFALGASAILGTLCNLQALKIAQMQKYIALRP